MVWYINKYMNSLYGQQDISFKDFIYTMNTILKMWNIQSPNRLMFNKFQNVERNNFYSDVAKYFKLLAPNTVVNNADILCMYHLYTHGIISADDLADMRSAIEPTSEGKAKRQPKKKTTQSINNLTSISSAATDACAAEIETKEMMEYKTNILQFIRNRASCNTCPLQKNGFLIVSTNSKTPANADIMFISDSASSQEIESQSHYSNHPDIKNATVSICDKYKLTYVFVNLMMCSSSGSLSSAKTRQAIQSCSGIYSELSTTFKSKINVLFGDTVKAAFGIKGERSTKLHGQRIGNNIVSVALDKLNKKYQTSLYTSLIENIKSTKFEKGEYITEKTDEFRSRLISVITPDLTLFDIKEINSEMLYIFTNKAGEKKYFIENLQFPIYLKAGSISECDYITEKAPDDTIYANKRELQMIKKLLRENVRNHINL